MMSSQEATESTPVLQEMEGIRPLTYLQALATEHQIPLYDT